MGNRGRGRRRRVCIRNRAILREGLGQGFEVSEVHVLQTSLGNGGIVREPWESKLKARCRPIEVLGEVFFALRILQGHQTAWAPRPKKLPEAKHGGLGLAKLPFVVRSRRRHVRDGAASRAIAHFRALGDVAITPGRVSPAVRADRPPKDGARGSALSEGHFSGLVRIHGESQNRIGIRHSRHARLVGTNQEGQGLA